MRYTTDGKRREMGLGSYPDVTLADVRKKAGEQRNLATTGIDPIGARQVVPAAIPTFTSCAARYIRAHRRGWKNAKHARQWARTIKTYARPQIGNHKVNSVTTEDIVNVPTPIWTTKTVTAKRLQGRIENILDYAAAHKYRDPLTSARNVGMVQVGLISHSGGKASVRLP